MSHCRKGMCALATKEDNHYLTPSITYVVWFGTVNALAQDRITGYPFASIWKAVLYSLRKSEMSFQKQLRHGSISSENICHARECLQTIDVILKNCHHSLILACSQIAALTLCL